MDMELAWRSLEQNGLAHRIFFVRDEREALACLLFEASDRERREETKKPTLSLSQLPPDQPFNPVTQPSAIREG